MHSKPNASFRQLLHEDIFHSESSVFPKLIDRQTIPVIIPVKSVTSFHHNLQTQRIHHSPSSLSFALRLCRGITTTVVLVVVLTRRVLVPAEVAVRVLNPLAWLVNVHDLVEAAEFGPVVAVGWNDPEHVARLGVLGCDLMRSVATFSTSGVDLVLVEFVGSETVPVVLVDSLRPSSPPSRLSCSWERCWR